MIATQLGVVAIVAVVVMMMVEEDRNAREVSFKVDVPGAMAGSAAPLSRGGGGADLSAAGHTALRSALPTN